MIINQAFVEQAVDPAILPKGTELMFHRVVVSFAWQV